MSLRNRFILPMIFSALAVLAGCGGNSPSPIVNPTPPPSGGFSTSNLNGTYVFSISGIDVNAAPYAIAGTFTANGQGAITAGALDVNDAGLSTPVLANQSISSSSYTVSADGRGKITLSVPSLGSGATIVLDFVLQDSSHGFVTEFDSNATGSGSLDLQTSGVSAAGTYAFSLAGSEYLNGTTANAFGTVGNFTVGSGGAISGVQDFNDGQFAYTDQTLTGSLVLGPSSAPSTSLSASFPTTTFGAALTFDAFAIDASHLKFIEMDTFANLAGDAFAQTSTTIPTGTLAFELEGAFPSTSGFAAAGGFIVTDGAGNITSASNADFNNSGTVSPSPVGFTGTYTAAGTGRYTLSLAGFSDGTSYVAYPFNGGVFLLEVDSSGNLGGAAYPQTQNTFAASEGYGLNFTGDNLASNVEVDDIAEFTSNSSGSTVTGVVDENFEPGGGPNLGLALTGTYATPDSSGRGQIGANSGTSSNHTLNGGFTITYYSVDGTTYPFIETDANGQVAAGAFFKQNASASSAASAVSAKAHLFVRPLVKASSNWKRRK